jgi:hypothetical protein
MSKTFSPVEWAELRTHFQERRDKQLQLTEEHESAGSYGMAYLALWVALESFAKRLGPVSQRQELKEALSNWLGYLNYGGANKPDKISIGKFDIPKTETAKIPSEAALQKLFPRDSGLSFYLATDPKKKYRIRRNDIAHKAEAPSLGVYADFKEVASKALEEIEVWLAGSPV